MLFSLVPDPLVWSRSWTSQWNCEQRWRCAATLCSCCLRAQSSFIPCALALQGHFHGPWTNLRILVVTWGRGTRDIPCCHSGWMELSSMAGTNSHSHFAELGISVKDVEVCFCVFLFHQFHLVSSWRSGMATSRVTCQNECGVTGWHKDLVSNRSLRIPEVFFNSKVSITSGMPGKTV